MWEKDSISDEYKDESVVLCPEELMIPRVNGALGLLDGYDYVGWVADDNRFETVGWDEQVISALSKVPIVFCNDVVSPGSKPSHVFMDARIPRALGWLLLPELHSAFFDDVWANLGVGPIDVSGPLFRPTSTTFDFRRSGLGIAYLAEVRVNHLYVEKDNAISFRKDMERYRAWLRNEAEDDIGRARGSLRSRRDALRSSSPALSGAQ